MEIQSHLIQKIIQKIIKFQQNIHYLRVCFQYPENFLNQIINIRLYVYLRVCNLFDFLKYPNFGLFSRILPSGTTQANSKAP